MTPTSITQDEQEYDGLSYNARTTIASIKSAKVKHVYRIGGSLLSADEFKSLKPCRPEICDIVNVYDSVTPEAIKLLQAELKKAPKTYDNGDWTFAAEHYKKVKKVRALAFDHPHHGACYLTAEGILSIGCQTYKLSVWERSLKLADDGVAREPGTPLYYLTDDPTNISDLRAALPVLKAALKKLKKATKKKG